ncbi:para-aminobenzoate synthetase [Alteromonadaceae bacterium 2753L.S.0a.02]|nr:para-aminobenzoate synthetase [Alteromonadaceae bacterium 2753L.S.0a.02]
MKTLLIDNFDSFTYNLYQLIAEVNRVAPVVIKNNSMLWPELKNDGFDNIVISPGPGRPENAGDFGICSQVICEADVPVLGVCLGHQGLCHLYGGEIDYAEKVMHGRVSEVFHNGDPLFANIPSPFKVVRYHSLYVRRVPQQMTGIAQTHDGINMAVRHNKKPLWGVQFHPESICSEYGRTLLTNFRDLSRMAMRGRTLVNITKPPVASLPKHSNKKKNTAFTLFSRRLTLSSDPEQVFVALFAQAANSFWIDAQCYPGSENRFSYMGDSDGPHAEILRYEQCNKSLKVEQQGIQKNYSGELFQYLKENLGTKRQSSEDLPFDFNLGYVGYFGYEMKGDCGYASPHRSQHPDASLIFCDRMVVFDHAEHVIYLACLDTSDHSKRVTDWLNTMQAQLTRLADSGPADFTSSKPKQSPVQLSHSDAEYLKLIDAAKAYIRRGESYEICLTRQLRTTSHIPPFQLYQRLRRGHPAPYAGYFKFGELEIISCSPEKFLSIDAQGCVTTKPIKGTRPRSDDPETDAALKNDLANNEKDRAENLMIVDLLRNDLGQVSEVGSVRVSRLFEVESYSGVHQLVTTVSSRLRRDCDALDCLRACFPGGSMTGAPKKRTLEIIDELEGAARGVYSGALGFLALNGGADLSIVIRTLVCENAAISLGVGGAIVDLSDAQTELEETRVKSYALLSAL